MPQIYTTHPAEVLLPQLIAGCSRANQALRIMIEEGERTVEATQQALAAIQPEHPLGKLTELNAAAMTVIRAHYSELDEIFRILQKSSLNIFPWFLSTQPILLIVLLKLEHAFIKPSQPGHELRRSMVEYWKSRIATPKEPSIAFIELTNAIIESRKYIREQLQKLAKNPQIKSNFQKFLGGLSNTPLHLIEVFVSPNHYAAGEGRVSANSHRLTEERALFTEWDINGYTPAAYATEYGRTNVLTIFNQNHFDLVHQYVSTGSTLLTIAGCTKQNSVLNWFLEETSVSTFDLLILLMDTAQARDPTILEGVITILNRHRRNDAIDAFLLLASQQVQQLIDTSAYPILAAQQTNFNLHTQMQTSPALDELNQEYQTIIATYNELKIQHLSKMAQARALRHQMHQARKLKYEQQNLKSTKLLDLAILSDALQVLWHEYCKEQQIDCLLNPEIGQFKLSTLLKVSWAQLTSTPFHFFSLLGLTIKFTGWVQEKMAANGTNNQRLADTLHHLRVLQQTYPGLAQNLFQNELIQDTEPKDDSIFFLPTLRMAESKWSALNDYLKELIITLQRKISVSLQARAAELNQPKAAALLASSLQIERLPLTLYLLNHLIADGKINLLKSIESASVSPLELQQMLTSADNHNTYFSLAYAILHPRDHMIAWLSKQVRFNNPVIRGETADQLNKTISTAFQKFILVFLSHLSEDNRFAYFENLNRSSYVNAWYFAIYLKNFRSLIELFECQPTSFYNVDLIWALAQCQQHSPEHLAELKKIIARQTPEVVRDFENYLATQIDAAVQIVSVEPTARVAFAEQATQTISSTTEQSIATDPLPIRHVAAQTITYSDAKIFTLLAEYARKHKPVPIDIIEQICASISDWYDHADAVINRAILFEQEALAVRLILQYHTEKSAKAPQDSSVMTLEAACIYAICHKKSPSLVTWFIRENIQTENHDTIVHLMIAFNTSESTSATLALLHHLQETFGKDKRWVTTQDSDGNTPLHLAFQNSEPEIQAFFIAHYPVECLSFMNTESRTPLSFAQDFAFYEKLSDQAKAFFRQLCQLYQFPLIPQLSDTSADATASLANNNTTFDEVITENESAATAEFTAPLAEIQSVMNSDEIQTALQTNLRGIDATLYACVSIRESASCQDSLNLAMQSVLSENIPAIVPLFFPKPGSTIGHWVLVLMTPNVDIPNQPLLYYVDCAGAAIEKKTTVLFSNLAPTYNTSDTSSFPAEQREQQFTQLLQATFSAHTTNFDPQLVLQQTTEQQDSTSCGTLLVKNAKRLLEAYRVERTTKLIAQQQAEADRQAAATAAAKNPQPQALPQETATADKPAGEKKKKRKKKKKPTAAITETTTAIQTSAAATAEFDKKSITRSIQAALRKKDRDQALRLFQTAAKHFNAEDITGIRYALDQSESALTLSAEERIEVWQIFSDPKIAFPDNGYTLCHFAALQGRCDIFSALFEKHNIRKATVEQAMQPKKGSRINTYSADDILSAATTTPACFAALDKSGNSPLHIAMLNEQKSVVEFLVQTNYLLCLTPNKLNIYPLETGHNQIQIQNALKQLDIDTLVKIQLDLDKQFTSEPLQMKRSELLEYLRSFLQGLIFSSAAPLSTEYKFQLAQTFISQGSNIAIPFIRKFISDDTQLWSLYETATSGRRSKSSLHTDNFNEIRLIVFKRGLLTIDPGNFDYDSQCYMSGCRQKIDTLLKSDDAEALLAYIKDQNINVDKMPLDKDYFVHLAAFHGAINTLHLFKAEGLITIWNKFSKGTGTALHALALNEINTTHTQQVFNFLVNECGLSLDVRNNDRQIAQNIAAQRSNQAFLDCVSNHLSHTAASQRTTSPPLTLPPSIIPPSDNVRSTSPASVRSRSSYSLFSLATVPMLQPQPLEGQQPSGISQPLPP